MTRVGVVVKHQDISEHNQSQLTRGARVMYLESKRRRRSSIANDGNDEAGDDGGSAGAGAGGGSACAGDDAAGAGCGGGGGYIELGISRAVKQTLYTL